MKERIEELAEGAYDGENTSYGAIKSAITTAVNEAIEMAAKECDKEALPGSPPMWISAASKNAAAIRKLKV